MADDSMALLETLRKASAEGDVDVLREGVRILAQAIMEAEVTELTGVPKGERDPERRLTHRNGYRDRRWDTRVGTIELAIPRVRDGCYLPSPARARAGAPSGPCSRSSRRRTCRGHVHPPGRRPRPGPGHRGHQQERGEPHLRGARRRGRGVPVPARSRRGRCPVPLARRDVPQGPRGRTGRVDGRARRDRRRAHRRAPGARSRARRGQRRGIGLAALRPLARRARPRAASASSSATTTPGSSRRSTSSSSAPPGSAAGCT